MKRRGFITLVGGVAAWPLWATAQSSARIPRVGILWHAGSAAEEGNLYDSLKRGFADLGYVSGKNIVFEDRFPGEVPERFYKFAKELVDLPVDVLVASSIVSALAAQKATATIPIVFLPIVDPVALKLVPSLARPGGNLTGLSTMGADVAAKRVQLVKEAFPHLSSIALLIDPAVPFHATREIPESRLAAAQLQMSIEPVEAHELEDLEPAFRKIVQSRLGAVIVTQGPMTFIHRKRIADLALEKRIPAMGPADTFVESDLLMSYGPSWPLIYRRAAVYVDKILKGAKPGDLPVEQPTRFDLAINLKTAKALAVDIPLWLLARADRVIE